MGEREIVPFTKLIEELKKEYVYHKTGGTSFRQLISLIGLVVVLESGIKRVEYFFDRENVKTIVEDLMPTLDAEKSEAVIKHLCTIAKDLHLKAILPVEVKEYIQQKRQGKNPLSFVQKTKQDNDGE